MGSVVLDLNPAIWEAIAGTGSGGEKEIALKRVAETKKFMKDSEKRKDNAEAQRALRFAEIYEGLRQVKAEKELTTESAEGTEKKKKRRGEWAAALWFLG